MGMNYYINGKILPLSYHIRIYMPEKTVHELKYN